MKRICSLLIALLFITACSSEPMISLKDIIDVFENKGIKLIDKNEKTKYFVLNGKKAITYKLGNGENISFYVFSSEKNRKKGLDDFNKQKGEYDMQIPSIHEVENVLILYWYNGETGSKTQYDANTTEAVEILATRYYRIINRPS